MSVTADQIAELIDMESQRTGLPKSVIKAALRLNTLPEGVWSLTYIKMNDGGRVIVINNLGQPGKMEYLGKE